MASGKGWSVEGEGKMPSSGTGGVKAMNIASRLVSERERLLGMSDEERAYRRQWLQDQHLSPNEPRFVPEYYRERLNPIRRFYRWPLDTLANKLQPVLGNNIHYVRFYAGKLILFGYAVLGTHYYFKYHTNDWSSKSGWRVMVSRTEVLKGDPGYPGLEYKKPSEYLKRGFENSPI